MKKRNPLSVDEDVLKRLEKAGEDSPIIGLRLGYMDREGLRKNLATLAKFSRAHPDILPTQASGRWSTSDPNLGGFDKEFWKLYHDIIYPDPNEWWLEWDWSGIETRMFVAYSRDEEDLIALDPTPIWCSECGHAHDDTTLLACWNPGGRRVIRASKNTSGQEIRPAPENRTWNNRLGCSAPSGVLSTSQGSQKKISPWAKTDLRPDGMGAICSRVDDDVISANGRSPESSNPRDSLSMEKGTSSSQASMVKACCVCGCENTRFEPADIHTLTCSKYLFEWERLPNDWEGSKDIRRTRAKNFRYGVGQYGRDKRAVLQIPNVEKFGLTRSDLLARAERFLYARPDGVAFKQRAWAEAIEKRESRTFYGRRRYLYGDSDTRAKEGLNHKIQGSVADMMDWCLIEVWRRYGYGLVLNKHDGAIIRVPQTDTPESTLPKLRELVEREWDFDGHRMRFPAEWAAYFPDGRKESLHATT